jgi:integrase
MRPLLVFLRGEQPRKPDAFLLRDVTTTLVDCGLRPDECFRLKPENVRDGAIWIYEGKRQASRRRIKITAQVQAIAAMRLSRTAPDSWLFGTDQEWTH